MNTCTFNKFNNTFAKATEMLSHQNYIAHLKVSLRYYKENSM